MTGEMKNTENHSIEKQNYTKRMYRRMLSFLLIAAMVVSCCTVWLFGFTEVAMADEEEVEAEEEETFCGLEEHEHDEDCYEKILICGQEECDPVEGHTHTEACYRTEKRLICGLKEGEPEEPEEAEEPEETEEPNDADDADDADDAEEAEETAEPVKLHTHTAACYETVQVLVCDLEECEPVEGHTHTEECYETGTELICELPEHEHTEQCYSDDTADVEDSSIWEATLPTELAGIWDEDVVAIAASQLGYTESEKNFLVNENGTTIDERRKGYTRYGAWYGDTYGDWCAMFVSFCLYYAGVPKTTFPEAANCAAWTEALDEKGLYREAETTDFVPESGDLIFFKNRSSNSRAVDHVGIVESVEWDTDENGEAKDVMIHTIEGNSGNCVRRNIYSIDNGTIVGYGVLPKPGMNDAVTLASEDSVSDVAGIIPALFTDGYEYIGTLSIPGLELELPVMRERSCLPLWIAPVQYDGFLSVDNPVISGYNYTNYFGNLKYLTAGDAVTFTDTQGDTFAYTVDEMLLSQPDEEEMAANDWDLTLLTCTITGDIRVAVHCTRQT